MGLMLFYPPAHAAMVVFSLSFVLLSAPDSLAQTPEFRLIELEQQMRSHPADPSTPEGRLQLFALAEARFDSRLQSHRAIFESLDRREILDAIDWLSLVYRLKSQTDSFAPGLDTRLKEALASRSFFEVFDDKRVWRWQSPSGHQFEFRESVDRLEVYRDGLLFYTLQLG